MKIKIFILRFKCYYSKTNHVVNKQCEYGVHVTNCYIHAKFERVLLNIYRDIHHSETKQKNFLTLEPLVRRKRPFQTFDYSYYALFTVAREPTHSCEEGIHFITETFKLKALNSDKLASSTLPGPNNTYPFQIKCLTGNGWRDTPSAPMLTKTVAYNFR